MKYVVLTGGPLSGLGKGTTISSIGVALKCKGYRVTAIKMDPYLNVDAGTMSPFEHGEVFVLQDGGEVDLDLGNYERFLGIALTRDHNLTTGKVYQKTIEDERRGAYLGRTVQMIPHVTDCIQNWIQTVSMRSTDGIDGPADICLVEVGGTTGDIEASVYLEALQQMFFRLGPDVMCLCHLTYVPTINGEQKTKPTQQSVRALREAGIQPQFIFVRSDKPLESGCRDKLSLFSQVAPERIISLFDVPTTYAVTQVLEDANFTSLLQKILHLGIPDKIDCPDVSLELWKELARRSLKGRKVVNIGLVGKYTELPDAYLSVTRALGHACNESELTLNLKWIESSDLEDDNNNDEKIKKRNIAIENLKNSDGIICPGGFGTRGIKGLVFTSKHCRENKIPYLGICLGLQTMVIEIAQNVLQIENATSEEFEPEAKNKVVVYMPETASQVNLGGTMRLGVKETIIEDKNSLAYKLYDKKSSIFERHRHRYEVNKEYVPLFEKAGFVFSGRDTKGERMEILEAKSHPFYLSTQFHPEFTSTPTNPNPLFLGFILASAGELENRLKRHDGCLIPGSGFYEFEFAQRENSPNKNSMSPKIPLAVLTTADNDVENVKVKN